jgi:ribosomal protein L16 Arg81 hydroxylase
VSEPVHDLRTLLGSVTVDDFLDRTWGNEHLVVRAHEPERYRELVRIADLDELIFCGRPVVAESEFDSSESRRVLRGRLRDDEARSALRPSGRKLWAQFEHGRTLLLHGVHLQVPAIARLARELEVSLQCRITSNLYLTPTRAQGFDIHFDDHDVFVLQLEGTKIWQLYQGGPTLPLRTEDCEPVDQLDPLARIELRTGDLLYLPRGIVHEAHATDAPSLHLSLGVQSLLWVDAVVHAIRRIAHDDPRLRAALPVGWVQDRRLGDPVACELDVIVRSLADRLDWPTVLGDLAAEFAHHLPELPGTVFGHRADADAVTLNTALIRPAGLVCVVIRHADAATIYGPQISLRGPVAVLESLEFVASEPGPYPVSALPGAVTDRSRVALARRLIEEGFLQIDPSCEPMCRGSA